MFADSLLDVACADRSRRNYVTIISFGIEALAVAALLIGPLLYVHGLPQLQWTSSLIAPPAPPPLPIATAHSSLNHPTSNLDTEGHIIAPHTIPISVVPVVDDAPPAPVDARGLGVVGSTGDGRGRTGIWGSAGSGLGEVAPPTTSGRTDKPPRISQMMEGNLIYRVQPTYPSLARAARIQGPVVLHAVIGRDGRIENLQVVNGHPMLAGAAIEAVKQWRYRPYVLNGEPIEVETQITVNFNLAGG
jgi:protein TonB